MHAPGHISTSVRSLSWKSCIPATVFLLVAFGVSGGSSAFAQKGDVGRQIANELLRALIESQQHRQGHQSFRPERPGFPGPGQIPQPNQATAEMQQIRKLLASVTQESATLSTLLSEDSRRSVAVRSLVPDALNFQASATVSKQQADRENNHLMVLLPIQALDQNWKPLAHQLSASHDVSPQTRECTERINRLNAQLCRILGIQEQFNSRDLVRAADLLAADLQTLAGDISYAGSPAGNRNRLQFRMRKLQEQAALFANLAASGAQFRNVVTDYQSLYQAWQGLRPELNQISDRSVTRTVSRLQETHRSIHQLLRLDFGLDQALVRQMADGLQRDMTGLYRSITLDLMLSLPDGRALPVSADNLFGTAQNLMDLVTRNESVQAIGEGWLYLDEQWRIFEFYLKPVQTPDIRHRVEGISQSIDSLKTAIGVSVSFDHREILQQSASIESMSDHLQGTVRRWMNRPGQQDTMLTAEVQGLNVRCRELQALASSSRDRNAMQIKCDEIIAAWQQLRPKLSQCQTDERESIEQTIDVFIPALIHLRTMLEG